MINRKKSSGRVIERLFKIIKYTYWNNYLRAYAAELESKPTHYFLMRGYDECHDGDEWIVIYDSLAQLKSVYKAAVQVLEQEHKRYGESNWAAEAEHIAWISCIGCIDCKLLLQAADAKAHVQLPIIAERVEICSTLAGEEGEALYQMYLEQNRKEG